MVYGFIKQSGSQIEIYSKEGHGTTVQSHLPYAPGDGLQLHDVPATELVAGGHETILAVEDDELVRRYVAA
jgi:hypothetical protein